MNTRKESLKVLEGCLSSSKILWAHWSDWQLVGWPKVTWNAFSEWFEGEELFLKTQHLVLSYVKLRWAQLPKKIEGWPKVILHLGWDGMGLGVELIRNISSRRAQRASSTECTLNSELAVDWAQIYDFRFIWGLQLFFLSSRRKKLPETSESMITLTICKNRCFLINFDHHLWGRVPKW